MGLDGSWGGRVGWSLVGGWWGGCYVSGCGRDRTADDDVVGLQRRFKSPGRGGSRCGGGSGRVIIRVIMDGLQSVVMDVPFVIVVKIPYLVICGSHAVFHLKRTNPRFLEFFPGMAFHPHEVVGVVTSEILGLF